MIHIVILVMIFIAILINWPCCSNSQYHFSIWALPIDSVMYDVDLQMHNSKHSDFLGSYTLFCLDVILDNFIAIYLVSMFADVSMNIV